MSALICGSVAYDTIMVFSDKFANHILPNKVHMLNVSFLVPQMRREFGGCAGNIAYSLKLLGGDGVPMATVGQDFAPYDVWLRNCGVSTKYIKNIPTEFTAQAFITTDLDDNQITAFHPGAMNESFTQQVPTDAGITLGVIAPDGRQGMIEHADQFNAANIPFIFDPGQGLPMFDGDDLKQFIEKAEYVIVNAYEASLIAERTGYSEAEIAKQVSAYIVTAGGGGSTIYTEGSEIKIPVATAENIVDPTGCGDAYRAGIIYGLQNNLDWEVTGKIASLMGAIKVACPGTQNHRSGVDVFKARFEKEFGHSF